MRQWKQGDIVECELSFAPMQTDAAPDGFIKGIASAPATDLYGHKVMPGAFDKSIRQKGLRGPECIKLLAHHDWHKIAGEITALKTVNDKLEIEGQLFLDVGYVKDLYTVAKHLGGLNFSVGFALEEFEFVEEDQQKARGDEDAWLIVKQGDLMEVSIVASPACTEAQMSFIKNGPINSLADLEKALVADGLCKNRSEASRFTRVAKRFGHLFRGSEAPGAPPVEPAHPRLDDHQLKAAVDQIARVKAILTPRKELRA